MKFEVLEIWLKRLSPQHRDGKEYRRGLFLAFSLLLGIGVLVVVLPAILVRWALSGQAMYSYFILLDCLVTGILIFLVFLNRRGYTSLATLFYLFTCIIAFPLSIVPDLRPFSQSFYVIPIVSASFLRRPHTSLWVALVCIIVYLISNAGQLNKLPLDSLLFLMALIFIALFSWFISARFDAALNEAQVSERKYIALLEKNPSCVYMAEGSQVGRWVYASPRIRDLLGFPAAEWLGETGRWVKQIHADDRPAVYEEMAQSLNFGLPFHAEYRMLHQTGRIVWVSDDAIPVRTPGEKDRVQGVLLDITARKRAEQIQQAVYRISQAAYAAEELVDLYRDIHAVLGELMPAENFFIALHDPETDLLHFPYFVDQFDAPPEPTKARHGLTEYVLRTGKSLFAKPEKFEELVIREEVQSVGSPSVDWLGVPLIVNNRVIGVMAVQSYTEGVRFSQEDLEMMTFVSTQVAMAIERKRTEAALREMNQLNIEVISGVNTGILVLDRDLHLLDWNHYMEQITGYTREELLGKVISDTIPLVRRVSLDVTLRKSLTGETIQIEDLEYTHHITKKTGWLAGNCGPHRNAQGDIIGMLVVINDITERKLAEDKLRAALSEKEVLLREIHHRVKNNMQVMSSLLSLQADTIDDPRVREYFNQMQARVRSMALVHEELYQSKDLARVNFAGYIERLAGGLAQTYLWSAQVNLDLKVDDVFLGVDTAIPCGLIINELVTNAFKYAFPGGRSGTVHIQLGASGENQYRLVVSDDGVGLPADLDIYNTQSLGMQLVTVLARQLRGTVQVDRSQGTVFQIDFRELKK